jgi:GNAT superfamily N-acetyltransferase
MISFRQATRTDLPAIIQLLADDPLGQLREQPSDPLPQSYYQAFEVIDQDPNQELMVVVEAEEIIGTFQMTFIQYLNYQGGSRSMIESVRVRKDKRGQKIGEKIILWAIDRSKSKGVKMLQLTSDKKRPDAIRFYERHGFVASHEGFKLHF